MLGKLLSELSLTWPTMEEKHARLVCQLVNVPFPIVVVTNSDGTKTAKTATGMLAVSEIITAILAMDTTKQEILADLMELLKTPCTSTLLKTTGDLAPDVSVDTVGKVGAVARPMVGYKKDTVFVEEARAHLFFNYTVLQYLNKHGAFTYDLVGDDKTITITVDVAASRDQWIFQKDFIGIPSKAIGVVQIQDMHDADHLTKDLPWAHYTAIMDQLIGEIYATLKLDVTSSKHQVSAQLPGDIIWSMPITRKIAQTKTSIYISPEVFDFVSKQRDSRWTSSTNIGFNMRRSPTFVWELRNGGTFRQVFFPAKQCRGKVIVVEDIPRWAEQSLVTVDELIAALKELGEVVREKLREKSSDEECPAEYLKGMTCI